MKCGAAEAPLIALDGRIAAVTQDEVDRDQVFWVEIVCMDPVDSSFSMDPGVPVISIWTQQGPAPQMEPALAAILESQRAQHEVSGVYFSDLSRIDLTGFPREVELAMRVRDDGWMAVASVQNFLAKCVVFDGLMEPPHSTVVAREPACLNNHQVHEAGPRLFLGRDAF